MQRGLAGLIVLLMLAPGCIADGGVGPERIQGTNLNGTPAPDWTLFDQDGKSLNLSDLEGEVVVLSFIFTRCFSVCPAITNNLLMIAGELGSDMDGVRFVSITTDPDYDSQARLKAYADGHGADWPHLTGDNVTLAQVWANYGIVVEKQFETEDEGGDESADDHSHDDGQTDDDHAHDDPEDGFNYTIGHTPAMYIIDEFGFKRILWTGYTWDPVVVASDIRIILDERN